MGNNGAFILAYRVNVMSTNYNPDFLLAVGACRAIDALEMAGWESELVQA